jgi:hypothetical protein
MFWAASLNQHCQIMNTTPFYQRAFGKVCGIFGLRPAKRLRRGLRSSFTPRPSGVVVPGRAKQPWGRCRSGLRVQP